MSENYEITRGSALTLDIVLRGPGPNGFPEPITIYDGSQTLTTTVWPGGGRVAVFFPETTWTDSSKGTIAIMISGSDTAAIDPGRYRLLTQLDDAGQAVDAYECTLDLLQGPGVGTALPTYCTFADLLDHAPWLEKLQRESDLAGFERQRNMARRWFDDLLQRHYRGESGYTLDFTFVPGASYATDTAYSSRDGRRSGPLQAWLDADGLDVTEQVRKAVACYAIGCLCERQITPGKDDTGYGEAARHFHRRAEQAAIDITAEIDSNGDNINDITIRLGIADTLEG